MIITMTCSCENIKKNNSIATSAADPTEIDWRYGWTVAASPILDMDALRKPRSSI